MDTSHYPSLGRLSQLSAQLAAARRRFSETNQIDLDSGERLLRATAAGDWEGVAALSEELSAHTSDLADEHLVRSAKKTINVLRRKPNRAKARRQVNDLLAACREAKLIRRAG